MLGRRLLTSRYAPLLRLASATEIGANLDSLFFVVRFPDEQAKTVALRHDVSANIVPEIVDGRGIKYDNPIEHIAATAYPVIPGLGPWIADTTDPLGLTYHKEVLPVGEYFKQSDDLQFEITPDYIDGSVTVFDEYTSNGNQVPLQLTHTGDGNKLGQIIQLYKAVRARQLPNKPAGSLSSKNKAYVLRLAQERNGKYMELDKLCAALGIQVTPEMDDNAKLAAIQARQQELAQLAQTQAAQVAASQQAQNGQHPNTTTNPTQPVGQQGQPATQLGTPQQPGSFMQQPVLATPATQPFNPVMNQPGHGQQLPNGQVQLPALNPSQIVVKLSQVSDSIRAGKQAQLDAAIAQYVITPAEAEALKQMHLTDEKLALALSQNLPCPIAEYITARAKGGNSWQATGRTPADGSSLSLALSQQVNQGGVSPLIANRMKREQARKSEREAYTANR